MFNYMTKWLCLVLYCIRVSYMSMYLYLSVLVNHLKNSLVNLLGVGSTQVMTTTLDKVKRGFRAGSKQLDMLSWNSRAKDRIRSTLKLKTMVSFGV